MFDIPWQDLVLSLGNFVFFLALLPSIFSEDKPAIWTSLITAFFLTTFIIAFASLELWLSAAGIGASAIGWWILAYQSYRRRHSTKNPPA